jgi:hypothetical protein
MKSDSDKNKRFLYCFFYFVRFNAGCTDILSSFYAVKQNIQTLEIGSEKPF